MRIDLMKMPFSRFGSYLALSAIEPGGGIAVRALYGGSALAQRKLLRLVPVRDGASVPYALDVEPERLVLLTDRGRVVIILKDRGVIGIAAEGVDLMIEFAGAGEEGGYGKPKEDGGWLLIDQISRLFLRFFPREGRFQADAPFRLGLMRSGTAVGAAGKKVRHICPHARMVLSGGTAAQRAELEAAIAPEEPSAPSLGDFAEETAAIRESFARWCRPYAGALAGTYGESLRLALYVLWSSVVLPYGKFTRPAMLMSKNWMSNVWSWDHCFNALALMNIDPELAKHQFLLPFDHQLENGMLPDFVNPETALRTFTKPPIHGWCLRKLLKSGLRLSDAEKTEIYDKLAAWTRWWFSHRDMDGDMICQYDHGFESGWDNSSVFDRGIPVESPDLAAYLLMQMDLLADETFPLGKRTKEAAQWRELRERAETGFRAHFWNGRTLTPLVWPDHEAVPSASLLNLMPLVLGERLPQDIRDALVKRLMEGGFLAPAGLATEAAGSTAYTESNSYWRGPMWAPAVYLLTDGLRRGGAADLAEKIARRFCETVRSSGGMYENYDAVTGEGYDDPAYTWTASVYLLLLREYSYFEGCA